MWKSEQEIKKKTNFCLKEFSFFLMMKQRVSSNGKMSYCSYNRFCIRKKFFLFFIFCFYSSKGMSLVSELSEYGSMILDFWNSHQVDFEVCWTWYLKTRTEFEELQIWTSKLEICEKFDVNRFLGPPKMVSQVSKKFSIIFLGLWDVRFRSSSSDCKNLKSIFRIFQI